MKSHYIFVYDMYDLSTWYGCINLQKSSVKESDDWHDEVSVILDTHEERVVLYTQLYRRHHNRQRYNISTLCKPSYDKKLDFFNDENILWNAELQD